MEEVKKIINDFIEATLNYEKAIHEGNANIANKNSKIVQKRRKWLEDNKEINNPMFINLVNNENDAVRSAAAAALLHVDEKLALDTLEEVSNKQGTVGFSAYMAIQEYKKGNI